MEEEEKKPGIDYCCGSYDSDSGCCPFIDEDEEDEPKETGRTFGI